MQDVRYELLEDDTYGLMEYHGDEKVIEIPAMWGEKPVTLLNDALFKGHPELEEVILPETLRHIGSFVFDGCTGLKGLKLPEGLTDVWQYAFARSGLEVIEIPGSVKSIPPYTFKDCKNLALAIFHQGTGRIYRCAFEDCTSLKMVTVNREMEISHEAFEGCTQFDPTVRVGLKSQCKCPKCSPGKKKLDIWKMANRTLN